jgi:uncharacterized protein (TIGR02453 family)
MAEITIKKESFDFLKSLSKNNNREWFNAHKDRYLDAHQNIISFADALLDKMNQHDNIETASGKDCLFRIYKDVRFSKDKTPYHTYWSGGFKRATKRLRGGYYFHFQQGNSFAAGGFWGPEPSDLRRIRQDIDVNYKAWYKLLANKTLVKTFGKMMGEQVGSAPKGFSKDHPAIDLLRYKQFLMRHFFAEAEIYSSGFLKELNLVFSKMRSFLDFMSDVLTTDQNGVFIAT